jgi:hypothetical protein
MPTLSSPKLTVKLISGTSKVDVVAAIHIVFNEFEKKLINLLGLKFKLRCLLRGSDSGFNGADDDLFLFSNKTITADGTSTFSKTMSSSVLDEDWVGEDEVYARFTLQSAEALFPFTGVNDSPIVTGSF